MLYPRFYFTLLVFVLLSGCGGEDADIPLNNTEDSILTNTDDSTFTNAQAPKIGRIYTDITHYHPSFSEKWNERPTRSINFAISADVSDPQGLDNLNYIYIDNESTDLFWSLYDVEYGEFLDKCYVPRFQIFDCIFYNEEQLDSVRLAGWSLVAGDKDGNETTKSFEFMLPNGTPITQERTVVSDTFSGRQFYNVSALEAMNIIDNGLSFVSNPGTQSYRIEFTVSDYRAENYEFAFYGASPEYSFIAYADALSPSIASTPIAFGQKTVIDIPWSEISLEPGHQISQISGLHIKLLDAPIEWVPVRPAGIWFNYISFSEFLTL